MVSESVDVLAWFDDLIRNGESHHEAEAREARAAVVELIDKAGNVVNALQNLISAGQVDAGYQSILDDLTVALANIGPQS